jgi:hypothetical protein
MDNSIFCDDKIEKYIDTYKYNMIFSQMKPDDKKRFRIYISRYYDQLNLVYDKIEIDNLSFEDKVIHLYCLKHYLML